MAKPNYTSLLAQLGALQADVDDIDAQRQAKFIEWQGYVDIANDPNSTEAERISATQNAAGALQQIQALDASRIVAVSLVEEKEDEAYQFPEPLTAAEEDLFGYASTDYLESNPGSLATQEEAFNPQMEAFNDTLTLFSAADAFMHQSVPLSNPVPDGLLGSFYQSPSVYTPNYTNDSTDGFILLLTEEPSTDDLDAHAGAIITLSSGSNELKMTITSISATPIANMDIYSVDFEISAHDVVGLSYFENLSYNDTLNIKIESPSKSSYVGRYYDDDGIIG